MELQRVGHDLATQQQQQTMSPADCWLLKETKLDFPGGPVVKNLPANVGYMASIPGPRKIPHATGQLVSLCAATTELICHYWTPAP